MSFVAVLLVRFGDRMKGLMHSLWAVMTGDALFAKAVAIALIASSPKSPQSSLDSLRSVIILLVSVKMLLQKLMKSVELGSISLLFVSSSLGWDFTRKSLK